jgi:hypothetical protein
MLSLSALLYSRIISKYGADVSYANSPYQHDFDHLILFAVVFFSVSGYGGTLAMGALDFYGY